jgi:WD40 repeat protein
MGRLFAAIRIDSYLRCLSISSFQSSVSSGNKMQMVNIVVGGCDDGSIRLWAINKSSIEFIYRVDKAHTGGCTAIVSNEHIVASGGDDEGIIKIWKICRSE